MAVLRVPVLDSIRAKSQLPYGAVWGSCQLQLRYQENDSGFCSRQGFQNSYSDSEALLLSWFSSHCPDLGRKPVMQEYTVHLSTLLYRVACSSPALLHPPSIFFTPAAEVEDNKLTLPLFEHRAGQRTEAVTTCAISRFALRGGVLWDFTVSVLFLLSTFLLQKQNATK